MNHDIKMLVECKFPYRKRPRAGLCSWQLSWWKGVKQSRSSITGSSNRQEPIADNYLGSGGRGPLGGGPGQGGNCEVFPTEGIVVVVVCCSEKECRAITLVVVTW